MSKDEIYVALTLLGFVPLTTSTYHSTWLINHTHNIQIIENKDDLGTYNVYTPKHNGRYAIYAKSIEEVWEWIEGIYE